MKLLKVGIESFKELIKARYSRITNHNVGTVGVIVENLGSLSSEGCPKAVVDKIEHQHLAVGEDVGTKVLWALNCHICLL